MSANNTDIKKGKQNRPVAPVIILSFVLLAALLVNVFGKYIFNWEGRGKLTSDEFYFSAYLSGDPTMVNTYDAVKTVALPDEDNYSWGLYGEDSHTVDIDIRNYLDELRINDKDIEYTVSLKGKLPVYEDGEVTGYEEMDKETLATLATLTSEDKTLDTEYVLESKSNEGSYKKTADSWCLNITDINSAYNSKSETSYVDNFIITVVVQATKPYRSVINLDFVIYSAEPPSSYRLIEYSNYYELVIMAEVEPESLTLHWPKGISIDNTNPLTYTDNFTQREISENSDGYSMCIEKPLKAQGSASIYFFKDIGNSAVAVPQASKVPIKSEKETYMKNQICVTK
jgi:hypothetical protein